LGSVKCCFGGRILRGADTARIDQFASQGLELSHFVVEPRCIPTRPAPFWRADPGDFTVAVCSAGAARIADDRSPVMFLVTSVLALLNETR
jgi:hypothetical protein